MMLDSTDPNGNKKISSKTIEYLCFEGGGGKGAIYLGVIKGLEEKLKSSPLINFKKYPTPENRQVKGISGASAGAITAFMLAMGMSSSDIEKELKRYGETEFEHKAVVDNFPPPTTIKRKPVVKKVGIFETFFETMNLSVLNKYRIVQNSKREINYIKKKPIWLTPFANVLEISFNSTIEKFFMLKKIFKTPVKQSSNGTDADIYLHSFLAYRGIFSGISVRKYFKELLEKRLQERLKTVTDMNIKKTVKTNGAEITFEDFFNYFGCDLVITGTNVSQHGPQYFSLHSTPSFPVIDAVCISMNLPVIFKPIYVDHSVHKYKGNNESDYNLKYKGLWVDGGMLNNYPIHAFDKFENFQYNGATGGFNFLTENNYVGWWVAANSTVSDSNFNDKVLGFRLVDFSTSKKVDYKQIFNETSYFDIFPYLGDLLSTFMYSGGQGQIRSEKEHNRTIYVNSAGIEVVDFSPLRQDFILDTKQKSVNVKERRIREAYGYIKENII